MGSPGRKRPRRYRPDWSRKGGDMKGKGGKSFEAGDLVFAKVRGYPPWPARVINPTAKSGSKYQVFFFGTYETAVCKKEDMWLYNAETKERYGKQKRRFRRGPFGARAKPRDWTRSPRRRCWATRTPRL